MKKSVSSQAKNISTTILALEASTNRLSVALMHDGNILVERTCSMTNGHAANIVPVSIETLNKAGTTFKEITHVVAGCGPGSFTGIRVALSAAKGFCMAYNAVGMGLSGLEALASYASDIDTKTSTSCLVLADTRRGDMYAQLFDAEAQPMSAIFEASASRLADFVTADMITTGIKILGVGRDVAARALNAAGVKITLPLIEEMPNAGMLANLAVKKIKIGEITPLKPLYIAKPLIGLKK